MQRTLCKPSPILFGKEPHSGHAVRLQLLPAPAGTGVVFTTDRSYAGQQVRAAVGGGSGVNGHQPNPRQSFRATVDSVFSTDICLALGDEEPRRFWERPRTQITHIEHLNAALFALGIDNVYVHLAKDTYARDLRDKRAVPILASCTLGFVRAVCAAGVQELEQAAGVRTLTAPIDDTHPTKGDHIRAVPLDDPRAPLQIAYRAGYRSLGVEDCDLEIELTPASFLRNVAFARTMLGQLNRFPLTVARLLGLFTFPEYGFGIGVSTANTMAPLQGRVVGGYRFGSPGAELVRHKIVDFLGAVGLLGPLSGIRFEVTKSGHANDLRVLRLLRDQLRPVSS